MRNIFLKIGIALLVVILFCSACKAKQPDVAKAKLDLNPIVDKVDDDLNTYTIDEKLDTTSNVLVCAQKVEFKNRTGDKLSEICFHLYANAFRMKDTAPFAADEMAMAYPKGFDSGYIEISSMNVNGKKADFKLSKDKQLLSIPMTLKKNKKIVIDMKYTVKIPRCEGRFGKGDDTYNINNCYPILCAYKGKWIKDGYDKIGDPFFSETANYEITVTAPKTLVIAATGEQVLSKTGGSFSSITYMARAVRDFSWIASEKFVVYEQRVGKTLVVSYSLGAEGGQDALKAACKALTVFNKLFGEYPYNRLSVVCADFYVGGMEYPMLVMIDRRMYTEDIKVGLEYVVAHEVAHQWWYGLVGNDEVNEPWLDEALTEYSTLLYYKTNYGQEAFNSFYQISVVDNYKENMPSLENERIDKPISQFKTNREYSAVVYAKGAMMMNAVDELIGEKNFYSGLKKYYENNRFKIAEKQDLITSMEDASSMRLDGVFNAWLEGKVAVE